MIEQHYRQWYGTQRWRNRAALQMKFHPLCFMCLAVGVTTPAEVADHITPHNGDYNLFWFGKLQSLCSSHHSGSKRQLENKGFVDDIGDDGWPIDSKHPVYNHSHHDGGLQMANKTKQGRGG